MTLVFKTKYQTDKAELEIKTFDVTGFVKKTKLTELETKVPHKISSLVKKADYDTKISELEKKFTCQNRDQYITTREVNTLAVSILKARLAQANLIRKRDFDAKLSNLNRKGDSQ